MYIDFFLSQLNFLVCRLHPNTCVKFIILYYVKSRDFVIDVDERIVELESKVKGKEEGK